MKVRLLLLLSIELFSFSLMRSQTAETPSGSGTSDDPYQISSLENLYWLSTSDSIWSDSCYFVQTADIDAAETSDWNSGEGFTPIGTKLIPFTGEYKGKGHIVESLYINTIDSINVGLFGYVKGVTIDSLGITNCEIIGGQYVGGLLGSAMSSNILDCYCKDVYNIGVYDVGGIIGYSNGSIISQCYSFGNVAGKATIGGFCGYERGSDISKCYSAGFVYSKGSIAGGFVGYHGYYSKVYDCYSTCSVYSKGDEVAGFIAHDFGSTKMINCYSTGFVSGGDDYYGGLVASNLYGESISYCYFNTETTGQVDAVGAGSSGTSSGLTSAEMMQDTSFVGWDFDDVWEISNGQSFPRLRDVTDGPVILSDLMRFAHVDVEYLDTIHVIQMDAPISSIKLLKKPSGMELVQDSIITWTPEVKQDTVVKIEATDQNGMKDVLEYKIKSSPFLGNGEKDDPFLISSLEDLDSLSNNNYYWSCYFEQTEDINATETSDWNDGEGFSPIGNSDNPFEGQYDGGGFKIDSLCINQSDNSYIGMFGYTKDAVVDSVVLANCEIVGNNYVGGIIGYGYNYSKVRYCSSTGSVTGNNYVGGLLGYINKSTVAYSYNAGIVSASKYVGGLIGYINNNATVSNNYSTASVSGDGYVGGLIGYNNESEINFCYSVGNVCGDESVGCLLGGNYYKSTVIDCYYNCEIGETNPGIGKDLNDQSVESLTVFNMKKETSFEDWDFADVWEITDGETLPRLRSVYDIPVILQNLKCTAKLNTLYSDTIRVVPMDVAIDSVHLVQNPSEMTVENDSIIVWTPEVVGDFTVEIKATDDNGLGNIYAYSISVYPFEGQGTEGDPFLITNLTDLDSLSNNSSYWSSCFIQAANIDASETLDWNQGAGFSPIGNSDTYFTGSYNGNDFYIDSLFINRSDEDYVGLFGYVSGGEIDSLTVSNVTISGSDYAGGLAGFITSASNISGCISSGSISGNEYIGGFVGMNSSYSDISKCYSSGYVNGTKIVGGLVGFNGTHSSISDSYSLSAVIGEKRVGGLIGCNYSTGQKVNYCYSVGKVTGDEYSGGFIGYNYSSSTILSCYCNIETSGQNVSIGNNNQVVDSLSILEMKDSVNFEDWDFTDTWEITEGVTFPRLQNVYDGPVVLQNLKTFVKVNNLYSDTICVVQMDAAVDSVYISQKPSSMILENDSVIVWTSDNTGDFAFEINVVDINGVSNIYIDTINVYPFEGEGIEDNPFHINNLADLDTLSSNSIYWGDYFIQTADIDASESVVWNDGGGFSPIGNSDEVFAGSYNGAGHIIDSICIMRSDENCVGLFGCTSSVSIDSLGITNCYIEGGKNVGALTGYNNSSSISNCYVSGKISGDTIVGAITGNNKGSAISNCYNASFVSGDSKVGGLVGKNFNSATVTNCYNTGLVQGLSNTGAVVGYNYSYITDCYYYVGINENTGVGKDYKRQSVTALSLLEMKDSTSFENWDFDSVWEIDEGNSFPRLRNVEDAPVILQDITLTLKVAEELSDTIRVVSMDAGINSFEIVDKPSDMQVIGDTILLWSPSKSGDYKMVIDAEDNNGLMNVLNYTISVNSFEGLGTAASPYQIKTFADLDSLANQSDYWSSYFIQTADIDASESSNESFSSIGNVDEPFIGNYNGKGHVIDGLFISSSSQDYVALFGYVSGATVDSIGVINCNVKGSSYVGGLIGYGESLDIFNSYSSGTVNGDYYVGGMIGYSASSSAIASCYSLCRVDGKNKVGGLIGVNDEESSVEMSYSAGLVSGTDYVGGFIGYSESDDLEDCYFNLESSGQSEAIGADIDTCMVSSLTIASMKNPFSYYSWDFWEDWEIEGYVSFPRLKDVKDAPFIIQDLTEELSLGEEYRDTVRVVQMDAFVDSIGLIKGPEGMSLENDSVLVWMPSDEGVDSVSIAAYDANGLAGIYTYSISVSNYNAVIYGDSRISTYPNPVIDELKIEGLYFTAEVYIYKLTGELVAYNTSVTTNSTINVSNLESGIYIMKVKDGKGVAESKFIKQ